MNVEELQIGDTYFTYYKNLKTGFLQVLPAKWDGGMVDLKRVREGRIFKSLADATKASKKV